MTDFHRLFNKGDKMEFADEIDCFLVDEVGDPDFINSNWYKPDGITFLNKTKKVQFD